MLLTLLVSISFNLFAGERDYYYSTQKIPSVVTKNNSSIESLYDCSVRVGKRFRDNKYLVNSYGINAEKGIVFFQGSEKGKQGLYFLREDEIQFTPYVEGESGEINVFPIPSTDSIKIGILKREGHRLVGTSNSFRNSTEFPRPQYPSSPYPASPKNVQAGPELFNAIVGGLSGALNNYCVMFNEKKSEDEKRNNREYDDTLDFGALQTCRFALKRTGYDLLATKIEKIITDCLKTPLDPVSKETKNDLLKSPEGKKESIGK